MEHVQQNTTIGQLTYTGNAYCKNYEKCHWYYEARCACGSVIWIRRSSVAQQSSCRPCANRTHGLTNSRLYAIWSGMKQRCADVTNKPYGGKGIKVCDTWQHSFENFHRWAIGAGYTDELTIDRIDANDNYSPNNCEWVSNAENQRRRSCPIRCVETERTFETCQAVVDWLARVNAYGERITDKAVYKAIKEQRKIQGYTFTWTESDQ